MPTTDPAKNLEYVKKAQAKKKEALGIVEYNKINAEAEQRHRDKLKSKIGEVEYKKQQADYMKEYRAKQRELKKNVEKKQKSINTITDAIRAKRARMQMQKQAIEKANKTANNKIEEDRGDTKQSRTAVISKATEAAKNLMEIGKRLEQVPQKKRGRPAKI